MMSISLNCRSNDIYDEVEMQSPVENNMVLENPAVNDGLPDGGISNPLYHPVQVFNNKGYYLDPNSSNATTL